MASCGFGDWMRNLMSELREKLEQIDILIHSQLLFHYIKYLYVQDV